MENSDLSSGDCRLTPVINEIKLDLEITDISDLETKIEVNEITSPTTANNEQISYKLEDKILELDERRKNIEQEINKLNEIITKEKILYREALDEQIKNHKQMNIKRVESQKAPILDVMQINNNLVENTLRECRETFRESKLQSMNYNEEIDINKLKDNLIQYRKTINQKDKTKKEKRKTAAKLFEKHLEEIDTKCNLEMKKINQMQKDVETWKITCRNE